MLALTAAGRGYDAATGGKKMTGHGNWMPPEESSSWLGKVGSATVSAAGAVVNAGAQLVGRGKKANEPDWDDPNIYKKAGGGGSYTAPGGAHAPSMPGVGIQASGIACDDVYADGSPRRG